MSEAGRHVRARDVELQRVDLVALVERLDQRAQLGRPSSP
jgi:hypothetical protein